MTNIRLADLWNVCRSRLNPLRTARTLLSQRIETLVIEQYSVAKEPGGRVPPGSPGPVFKSRAPFDRMDFVRASVPFPHALPC